MCVAKVSSTSMLLRLLSSNVRQSHSTGFQACLRCCSTAADVAARQHTPQQATTTAGVWLLSCCQPSSSLQEQKATPQQVYIKEDDLQRFHASHLCVYVPADGATASLQLQTGPGAVLQQRYTAMLSAGTAKRNG